MSGDCNQTGQEVMPYPYVNETANCFSKVENYSPEGMLWPFVVRDAVVEGRSESPKECVRTHTESCDDKHFPKVGLDLSKVGVSPRRNRVEAICRR